ncbi:hypothetical protein LCM4579_23780 [Ensifer sp. LCM 4579]|nr:hypothetical protein LCM4579_23780 [Ensifer sp. LCM 4579]
MSGEQSGEFDPIEKTQLPPEMVVPQGTAGYDLGETYACRIAPSSMCKQQIPQKFLLQAGLHIAYLFQAKSVTSWGGETVVENLPQLGLREACCLCGSCLAGIDFLECTREDTRKHVLIEIHFEVYGRPRPEAKQFR